MYRQVLAILLSLASTAAITNCGGGGRDASTGGGAGASQQSLASSSLIQSRDLAAGAKPVESLPKGPCNPLEVLGRNEAPTAQSQMFATARVRVQEAVGIFAADGPAVAAYDALNAKKRLNCIQETIVLQGALQGGVSVKVLSRRKLSAGDEAQSVPLQLVRLDSGQRNSVEVASIRSGRSVASLIFISTMEAPPEALVHRVIDAAAEQLVRARRER